MRELITATDEADHIRVEVHKSCIVEWSDDRINWHVFGHESFESAQDGTPVFKDFEVPLNGTRSYRAYNRVPETVSVTRRDLDYRVPSIEETARKLAALMSEHPTNEETT